MSVEIEFADPDTDTTTVVDASIGGGDDSGGGDSPVLPAGNGTPAAFPEAKGTLPKSAKEPEVEFADDGSDDDATPSAKASAPAGDDGFSAELLASAEQYGFTADEAKAFGSPDHLQRAMTALDRKAAAWAREEQKKTGQAADAGKTADQTPASPAPASGSAAPATPAAKPATPPAQTPAAAANPAAAADASLDKFKLELDPNEYDEGTISVLNGLNDHYDGLVRSLRGELDSLKSQLGMVSGRMQADEGARFVEQMDSFFDGLGDEFKETFGKGKLDDFRPDAQELANRQKLVEEMNALALADEKVGRKRSSTSDLAKRALNVLHADKLETIARKKVTDQVQKRNGQAISRPTGRTDKVRSPDAAAGQFASQFMRSKLGPEDGIPDEL